MIETEALMTVSDFLGFFSRNHFLEGGFTFQWVVGVFQLGGASFLSEGHAMRSVLMGVRGGSRKII